MADKQYRNREIEKAVEQRAKEDLERKAMEKARNERNYEIYLQKVNKAEQRARRKVRRQSLKGPIIFIMVIIIFCIILSMEQRGIHIMDLIKSFVK